MIDLEGVVPALGVALNKRGYEELTPVQKEVIEPELAGADMLVSAQTGSGKTVAFGLAIAPTLLEGKDKFTRSDKPLALVVAPTRELALQVHRELAWLYAETGAIFASCVGGMDMRTERRTLERGAHIVVGTPGRLRDHIMRKSLDPSELKAVVLDEADEMLDLGFKEDLEFILETTPEERRTLMFSATVPPMIGKLAKQYQNDAVRVTTAQEQKQHGDIEYRALTVAPRERENAIINVLRYYEAENALVFCNTRASVNHMMARLNNRGFSVVALSGELSQNERTHALQAMRDGRARVCIATDVAARGIDLPKLELVVHAELPTNPETLLHRSGRTGRAGRKGVSALMIDVKGRKRAERLLRFAKLNAEWAAPPSAEAVNRRDEERLLTNPIFTDPRQEEEADAVERLMEAFASEQIATAFLRMNRAGRSAPEEIRDVSSGAPEPYLHEGGKERAPRAPREEFANSIWVSLSVGRKQNAEPRWLIPLLCNAGDISKGEIGMIKMQNDETYVQLNADHGDVFFDALGPNKTLEKNIQVKLLDGVPTFDKSSGGGKGFDRKPGGRADRKQRHGGDGDREFGGGKPDFKKRKPRDADSGFEGSGKPKRKFGPKTDGDFAEGKSAAAPYGDKKSKPSGKPAYGKGAGKPSFGKGPGKKPDGKKPDGKKEGWAKKKPKLGAIAGGPKKSGPPTGAPKKTKPKRNKPQD